MKWQYYWSLLEKIPNIKGFGWNEFTLRILMGNIYGLSRKSVNVSGIVREVHCDARCQQ
jgi:hypothetical protein